MKTLIRQQRKKKKIGTAMEQAIDSMMSDSEKEETEEKIRPLLTIKIGKVAEKDSDD